MKDLLARMNDPSTGVPPRPLDSKTLIALMAKAHGMSSREVKDALTLLHEKDLITAWKGSDRRMPANSRKIAAKVIKACRGLSNGIGAMAAKADPSVDPFIHEGDGERGARGIVPTPNGGAVAYQSLNLATYRVFRLIAKAFLAHFDPDRVATARETAARSNRMKEKIDVTSIRMTNKSAPSKAKQAAAMKGKAPATKGKEVFKSAKTPSKPVRATAPEAVKAVPVPVPVAAPVKEDTTARRRADFLRLAEARTNRVIEHMRLIGNLSNTSNYDFTEADLAIIFDAIEAEIAAARARFDASFQQKSRRAVAAFSFGNEAPSPVAKISPRKPGKVETAPAARGRKAA